MDNSQSIAKVDGPEIVVAGASGYIGRSLLPKLLEKFPNARITAFSRSAQVSEDPRITWKPCDLFSLKSLEQALPEKCDLAYYLVHSMGPTATLDQGSFADYDLILADNFSRAIKRTRVTQLIYLGGLMPQEKSGHLSLHLQSRREVEATFSQYQLPVTVFRAGLILGEHGSSFQILLKLVTRLPIMICPKWTQNLTTPTDLSGVLTALTEVSLREEHLGKVYDLAGCKPITYIEMMRQTARIIGKKRIFLTVPFFTPTLSRLWVSLITNTSKNLVYPLVESLEHEMTARPSHLLSPECQNHEYAELLDRASMKIQSGGSFFQFRAPSKTVRSVQRLKLPAGRNAEWVKDQYLAWLPRSLTPFINVLVQGPRVAFTTFGHRLVLLDLELSESRSDENRQLLYIKRGLMVAEDNKGRLEFRSTRDRRFVLAAIHEYTPSLPWFIYRYTQAVVHGIVMKAFGAYISREPAAPASAERA